MFKSFLHTLKFDIKYILEDITLIYQFPTRKASWDSLRYHWSKIWDTLIFHPWYCLKRGIRNFFIWRKIIWGLDCYDFHYLQSITLKQLTEMEVLWRNTYVPEERKYRNQMDVGYRCQHTRIWKRVRWAKRLLELHNDEYYSMNWYEEHSKKYPSRMFEHDEEDITRDEYGVPIFCVCKSMAEDEREHYIVGSEISSKKDEKVWALYLKNIGTQRSWWN